MFYSIISIVIPLTITISVGLFICKYFDVDKDNDMAIGCIAIFLVIFFVWQYSLFYFHNFLGLK